MSSGRRQAILVLGMHRSGTSAMAGISHLCGAAAPAGMMDAAFDNPTGFWESLPITALNEAIFMSLGCHWFDALTFDAANIDAVSRRDLVARCIAALTKEFGDAPLLVLKDPRLSLLLDFWLPAFAASNVAVAPILALRHPAEVVSSMRRRDGMPVDIAGPMWLHYTLQSERRTRGQPRAVLSYDRLLQDWRGSLARVSTEAGIAWPIRFGSVTAEIAEFLRPHMRHHHAAAGKVAVGRQPLSAWIAETYGALRGIEEGRGASQYARLDRVHAEFAMWRAAAPRISLLAAAGREPLGAARSTPT